MSDDARRRTRRDDEDDFGPPLFGDDPTGEIQSGPRSDHSAPLSFGPSDTGPLPHWSDPPTGELPHVLATGAGPGPDGDATDDLDVWSGFSGQNPVWRGDAAEQAAEEPLFAAPDDHTAAVPHLPADEAAIDESVPVRREPGRITIGTDPTGEGAGRPMPRGRSRSGARDEFVRRPPPGRTVPARTTPTSGTAGRDMPMAIGVGLLIAAAFIVTVLWRPAAVVALVAVVVGLAAVEFFDKVTEKGYRPATVIGIAACAAAPLATYWVGVEAMPLIVVFALAAAAATFIGGQGVESGPMPNMAITMLGVTWIGLTGAFAALILGGTAAASVPVIGTDTIFLLALAVVANDVGALFVGSGIGKTPLRAWISPSKSVEGLIGGTLVTLGVLLLVGVSGKVDTWTTGQLVLLGVVVSITAPLGDLTESMFKRNLDIKDFGSLVRGHGGVLDRFDGFLFTLPAAYYLMRILDITIAR